MTMQNFIILLLFSIILGCETENVNGTGKAKFAPLESSSSICVLFIAYSTIRLYSRCWMDASNRYRRKRIAK